MAAWLATVLALAFVVSVAAQTQTPVRVCVPLAVDSAYLTNCTNYFTRTLGGANSSFSFTCVLGTSNNGCMTMIKNSDADISIFGGDELYKGYVDFNLSPLLAEDYGLGVAEYYSVAITTKAFCDSQATPPILRTLKGRRSCHTGYRKTSGWTLPVGYMVSQNIMPVVDNLPDVNNDAESVAAFFSRTCSPRKTADGPKLSGTTSSLWEGPNTTCTSCVGGCSESSQYYDYAGSIRCLMEGAGDVAFAKHTTPIEYASDGTNKQTWSSVAKADLRLICASGDCQPVENYMTCNMGRAAAKAVVSRTNWPSAQALATAMKAAGAAFIRDGKVLGGQSAFFFSASTQDVTVVTGAFETYFTSKAAYDQIYNMAVPTAKICTISEAEQTFCGRAVNLMNTKNLGVKFSCVQGTSNDDCLQKISNRVADMRTFDGSSIYAGIQEPLNLKVVVGEDYGIAYGTALEYYSVALVDRAMCDSNPNLQLKDFKGKRSCHTGFRKTSGWVMPVGYMLDKGIVEIKRSESGVEDDAESMAAFFSKTCAAGTSGNGPQMTADKKGALWPPLCSNCKGDCSQTANEPYQDYAGALRCLMAGDAEIAFAKHDTALLYAKDGSAPNAVWSTKTLDQIRLLCPTGGCKPASQFMECNLGRVASHAVMVRNDYENTRVLKAALATIGNDKDFAALVFNPTTNTANHLFKSNTKSLVPIDDDTRAFLGSSIDAYAGLAKLNAGGLPTSTPPPGNTETDYGGRLDDGAVAGIAVGCAVAGALLAGVGVWLFMRRKPRFDAYVPEDKKTVLTSASHV